MTHNSEMVYFGRSSLKVTLELLSLYPPEVVERMARFQVRTYAWQASSTNAALIAFWAGVLGQCHTAKGEVEELSLAKRAAFESLFKRSAPQVALVRRLAVSPTITAAVAV